MSNISFKPCISLGIAIVIGIIMIIIIILNKKNIINRILIIVVLFVFMQRPIIKNVVYDTNSSMYDIMFVIDRTTSMNAVDINNDTRLNAAKKSIFTIIDSFKNAYFTILTYDMYPEILYPLTREMDIIEGLINGMDVVNPNYVTTIVSLNAPYKELKKYLETEKRDKNVKRLVFFISDGEINSSDAKALDFSNYKSLANLIDDGAVLGYGTELGGKMLIKQKINDTNNNKYVDENGYLLDGDNVAISKYNEKNLKSLANNIGLEYVHVDNATKIKYVIERMVIERMGDRSETEKYTDLYYYLAFILLILFMIELYHSRRVA